MKAGRPTFPSVDEYRRWAGWTVRELADRLHCSASHASELCNGNTRVTESTARKLEAISSIPWDRWMQAKLPAVSA